MSASYFGKLFTEFTGSKMLDYLLKVRMEKAQELLVAEMDRDIAQIAEMVGYGNSAYFTTAFKKYTGFTPSRYREWHVREGLQRRD
ncbi:MAG: helix-turn-helix transcriptional regulator [Eubacteriales bacterium]|nr:helix-turn-helix transcriptional regulator [Eubacteriales bacterium]